MAPGLQVEWLGQLAYAPALALQQERVEQRRAGRIPDQLLLLEHPPVITLGSRAREENLRLGRDELARRGIEVHRVSRGGDVTYHAPGQLVGYLVADLAADGEPDVHRHLRSIEAALGRAAGELGVATQTLPGMTGLFCADPAPPPRKLASIGVGVRGWVSYHGFALNVELDLAGFDAIVPCGLHGVEMTSLARELGEAAPRELAARARQAVEVAFRARAA